jgi:hypothetical protein
MKEKLASRKFVLAVVAALVVILNDGLGWGVDGETVMAFATIVVGYIFGEAAVDAVKMKRG